MKVFITTNKLDNLWVTFHLSTVTKVKTTCKTYIKDQSLCDLCGQNRIIQTLTFIGATTQQLIVLSRDCSCTFYNFWIFQNTIKKLSRVRIDVIQNICITVAVNRFKKRPRIHTNLQFGICNVFHQFMNASTQHRISHRLKLKVVIKNKSFFVW